MGLFARNTDILSYGATWSLTAGTANSSFPLTNLNLVDPGSVSKLTGTSGTYRGTITSTAIQAIAIINCNLGGLTLTVTNNNSMASQNLVVPAAASDGLSLNAWIDLRAVTTAATQWNIAVPTNGANVAIGKILLIADVDDYQFRTRWRLKETKPAIVQRASRGQAWGYPVGTRYRTASLDFIYESQRAAYTTLRRLSVGPSQPCVFMPTSTGTDVVYAWFPNDNWEHERVVTLATAWSDVIEELNPGVAL